MRSLGLCLLLLILFTIGCGDAQKLLGEVVQDPPGIWDLLGLDKKKEEPISPSTTEEASGEAQEEVAVPDVSQQDDDGREESDPESMTEQDQEEEESPQYILSDSNTEYLSWEDIKELSKEELRIARNEIYARHGRRFQSQDLQDYFEGKDWYEGTIEPSDFREGLLNDFEKKNVQFLKEFEDAAISPLPGLPDAPSKEIIDRYGFENGYSVLSFRTKEGTLKDCGAYYQVDAVYYQGIEAPGNLNSGDQVTLVFDELTGETRTLVYRDDRFYPMGESNVHNAYYYHPASDGKSVVLYQDSEDRVEKPILEGKLYIRKDATKEIAIINQVEPVSTEILNREGGYNGVYFDAKGYVTRLVCYGD